MGGLGGGGGLGWVGESWTTTERSDYRSFAALRLFCDPDKSGLQATADVTAASWF